MRKDKSKRQSEFSKPLSEELAQADLHDARLVRRLGSISDALCERAGESLPKAMRTEAELEGAYRFFRNDKVSLESILAPHIEATCERARQHPWVIVVHDTTEFQFGGEVLRQGLGISSNKSHHGFYGHFALAVAPAEENKPLGVMGIKTFCRSGKKFGSDRNAYVRRLRKDPNKESLRWPDLIDSVETSLCGRVAAVHVMDREADNWGIFLSLLEREYRFVVRLTKARNLYCLEENAGEDLLEDLDNWPAILERDIDLSPRTKSSPYYCAGRHPVRNMRVARLRISAKNIRIRRSSNYSHVQPDYMQLNVVRVHEPEAPKGEEPIEWLLITTESIASKHEVARIVDCYRARWLIEEYFKAIKTGCGFEKSQLESYTSLRNELAALAPVAWRLLLLRNLARSQPQQNARAALSETQLAVLKATSKSKLSQHPTLQEALLAVAALGGHIKNNGPPGWQVLGRGYLELIKMEIGWMAAMSATCDQS